MVPASWLFRMHVQIKIPSQAMPFSVSAGLQNVHKCRIPILYRADRGCPLEEGVCAMLMLQCYSTGKDASGFRYR